MKKFLLFFVMLAIAGAMMAQDIYTAGDYIREEDGLHEAAAFKNGEVLYHSFWGSQNNTCTDVVVDADGNVFWVRNSSNGTSKYGDVFKNDDYYLNNSNTGSHLDALILKGSNVYAAGYLTTSSVRYATVWKDTDNTPYASWGDGVNDYQAAGIYAASDGAIYTCGYKTDSDNNYTAYVWKNANTTPEFSLPNVSFYDVCVYNGDVYVSGYEITGTSEMTAKIWKNGQELYILDEGWVSGGKMKIFGGDIYVTTRTVFNPNTYIWKNGQLLYTIPYTATETGFIMSDGVDVTPKGLYYTTSSWSTLTEPDYCDIYLNDEILYTTDAGTYLQDIYAVPEPYSYDGLTLPFYDGFELGETNWGNWTVVDEDHNNGQYASYWDLGGTCTDITTMTPATGNNYVHHFSNPVGTHAQDGWLVTPLLYLQVGRNVTLTFKSITTGNFANDYASVWVSTSNDPTDTDAYTKVWTLSGNNTSWEQQTVDLSAYCGQSIYVAFKYDAQGGANAPVWNIDEVNITESWTPGATITTFPYEEHFNAGFAGNTNWYLLDVDQLDQEYYAFWHWVESEQCAAHFFGSASTSQEGWMISPTLKLTSGMNYTLTFDTRYDYPGDLDESTVWIAVDKTGTPNPADYGQIWKETEATEEWTQRTIDLSSYAGHKVNIAFKYGGTYAHNWWIDNVVVTSALPQYTINVQANNASYGNVIGGGTFEQGQSCTINAMAYSGYEFKKWTKNGVEVSNNASYTFQVTENATYVAVFGEPSVTYYTITTNVDPAGAGTVEGGGTFASGTNIELKAIPNNGYGFTQWNDGNTSNPRSMTVTGNATFTASFAVMNYTLTVTANPAEGGTVTGGGTYAYGELVTLTATANEGYEFLNWNDGETTASRTVKVTGDVNYVANFVNAATVTYTITALSSNSSLGTVTGGGTYPEGTQVILTATPFGMNKFKNWQDGNTDNPRIITVTGDAAYVANFSGVGVDENAEVTLSLYPNPANESIHIEGLEANSEVVFYNVLGMMVKNVNANANEEINVSDLASGVYMIRCGNQTLRFVKK